MLKKTLAFLRQAFLPAAPAASITLPPVPPAVAEKQRSPAWPRVRREHLARFPDCTACGGTAHIQVHHLMPFHLDPSLELVESNLLTLCESPELCCHLRIGHLGRWDWYNEHAARDAAAFRRRLRDAARRTAGPYPKKLPGVHEATMTALVSLEDAVRKHRDTRGNQRCHEMDAELYEALTEGYTPPARDAAVSLDQCRQFIASRQDPRIEFFDSQEEIRRLTEENQRLSAMVEGYRGGVQ